MVYTEAGRYLNLVLLSALIVVGVAGNCLSILTWSRGRHRHTSTAVLLTALGFSNILVLLMPATEYWRMAIDVTKLRDLNLPMCKIFAFASYFGPTTTSWILVFVTFERVISMWFPFKVRYLCTRFKVGAALAVLILLCAGLYLPILLETDLTSMEYYINTTTSLPKAYAVVSSNSTHMLVSLPNCDISRSSDYYTFLTVPMMWVDMCAVCIIPFIFIVIGNILIIWKLLKRRTLGLLSKDGKAVTCRTRVANAFTVRAIALSITFCLFTSPITIYAVITDVLYDETKNPLLMACLHILFYANSSVNFFLYCAIGSGFKQDLRTVLRNMCRKRKISIHQQNTSKYVCDGHRIQHNNLERAEGTFV